MGLVPGAGIGEVDAIEKYHGLVERAPTDEDVGLHALAPRSRISTEGARRRADSRVWTGAAACAFRSKSGVCDCTLRVGADWLPEMPTSSILSVLRTAAVSASCADACCVASKRIDIVTARTPMVTWRCRLAKAAQPLRLQRLKQGVCLVRMFFI